MGKIIMASPKVIAVTFDQANSMKNKYSEFVKNNASDIGDVVESFKETKSEPLNFDNSVGTVAEDNNSLDNVSTSTVDNNIFSNENEEKATIVDNAITNSSIASDLSQKIGSIALTDAELNELEEGLVEVIKIAELSIHSVIEQYREKGKKKEEPTVAQISDTDVNNNDPVFASDTNIFDSPGESKSIA